MRRNELERDEQFAWEVLRKAHYATLAMTGADGTPYCVPVNHVADEAYHVLYFHCAGAGEKWQLLEKEPPVCLTAVSRMSIVPNEFETAYDSAVVRGQAQVVTDEGERTKALLLLVETLDPKGMGGLAACMERCFAKTQIVKIVPRQITGKQSHPSPKPTFGCGEH